MSREHYGGAGEGEIVLRHDGNVRFTKLPPSRLEIAMHLMAAMQVNTDLTHLTDRDFAEAAVEQAETLIEVEKNKKSNTSN